MIKQTVRQQIAQNQILFDFKTLKKMFFLVNNKLINVFVCFFVVTAGDKKQKQKNVPA